MIQFSRILTLGAAALALLCLTGCPKSDAKSGDDGLLVDSTPGEWGAGASENNPALAGNDDLKAVENNLNLPTIYFAYNSDALQSSEKDKLSQVADYLQENSALYLIIEGHCDQRGTEEYNRALGERRANIIRKFIAGNGVHEDRLRTISYGKDRPAVPGDSEEAWSRNRRGTLVPAIKK